MEGKKKYNFYIDCMDAASFKKWMAIFNSPPRVSSNAQNQKYLFNQISGCVFLGYKYIGQGQISGTSLIVHQYTPINAHNFSGIPTNLN